MYEKSVIRKAILIIIIVIINIILIVATAISLLHSTNRVLHQQGDPPKIREETEDIEELEIDEMPHEYEETGPIEEITTM